ncbi:UvrD-helicase domain-containing protein [Formicincola oecophyllae]|nr:UvrD-helicase domain-containing protein [Formicincola oecophyllae]
MTQSSQSPDLFNQNAVASTALPAPDHAREATLAQKRASDPRHSAFVSASAGSGKTKLLVDRLLRLMLPLELPDNEGRLRLAPGSDPASILCLTYTRAAAAEMAERLQKRLGAWVTMDDDALGMELNALEVPNTPSTRAQARSLFLRVLDLPGGMQIETIHSFCQSLLKRFPLEAAMDPHFTLTEPAEVADYLHQAFDEVAGRGLKSGRELATAFTLNQLEELIAQLSERSGRLEALMRLWQTPEGRAQLRADLKKALSWQGSAEDIARKICTPPGEVAMVTQLRELLAVASAAQKPKITALLDWFSLAPEKRAAEGVQGFFLKPENGTPYKMARIVGKKGREVVPELLPLLEGEAERQASLKVGLEVAQLLPLEEAFLEFAMPVLARFGKRKSLAGEIDYNDIILRTRALLEDPGARWVTYKLDGGLEHLLLDEVQDTSGIQWEIAAALTEEFFSGVGADESRRDSRRPRTVFAVGDFKQSIYSFQGAEPEAFKTWRQHFENSVRQAGQTMATPALNVSFRSAPPILALVDSVFAEEGAAVGVRITQEKLEHRAARSAKPGMVQLWPVMGSEPEGSEEPVPFRPTGRNHEFQSAEQRLAAALAEWLAAHLAGHGAAPLVPGTPPLEPRDVMILVRKKSDFLWALERELKRRGIAVASHIRSFLTDNLAVLDLMNLCASLLLPDDDLTLAAVLTSPFGGLSDRSLMDLATENGRRSILGPGQPPLWDVLRRRHGERAEWTQAWNDLSELQSRVDYLTPYELLTYALGPLEGRKRIRGRLGPESMEALEELLQAAATYAASHAPALQDFLRWLEESRIEVKREADSGENAVKLMTVHGSKGLQSRLVILPEMLSTRKPTTNLLWSGAHGTGTQQPYDIPLAVPGHVSNVPALEELRSERAQREGEENNRLLYVGLTRAEEMLLVCACQNSPKPVPSPESWYAKCRAGFESLKAATQATESAMAGQASPNQGHHQVFEVIAQPWPAGPTPDDVPHTTDLEPEDTASHVPEIITLRTKAAPSSARTLQEEKGSGLSLSGLPSPVPARDGGQHPLLKAPSWLTMVGAAAAPPRAPEVAHPFRPSRVLSAEGDVYPQALSPVEALALKGQTPRMKALVRGTRLHELLQFLPELPEVERPNRGMRWLAAQGLEGAQASSLLEEALKVMALPVLKPLFSAGARSEQALSGTLQAPPAAGGGNGHRSQDGMVVMGRVDRFTVAGDEVLLCDYKTGRIPPEGQTPAAYLVQMASYKALLRQIYPQHRVRCVLVWTAGPRVDVLDEKAMNEALHHEWLLRQHAEVGGGEGSNPLKQMQLPD